MKLITAPKYNPDHGDIHDPIDNPQVRGWYNKGTHNNKDSNIGGWNPYASLFILKDKESNTNIKIRDYGRPQRTRRSHTGLDIYAPVGTPIYACTDGVINFHRTTDYGFLTQFKGTYKGKTFYFQYLHLIQFKEDKFRFFNNYGTKTFTDDGWFNYSSLGSVFNDTYNKEKYKMSCDGSILEIDKNMIDIELGKGIFEGKDVKKGDIIGYTGATGNSLQSKDNNHLHFGIRNQDRKRISPYEMFKEYVNLDESGLKTHKKQDGETPSNQW